MRGGVSAFGSRTTGRMDLITLRQTACQVPGLPDGQRRFGEQRDLLQGRPSGSGGDRPEGAPHMVGVWKLAGEGLPGGVGKMFRRKRNAFPWWAGTQGAGDLFYGLRSILNSRLRRSGSGGGPSSV